MPRMIVIAGDARSNGKSASYVFHILYDFAPVGPDSTADPATLPSGNAPTGHWRAYLMLTEERSETVAGSGLMQSEIEFLLRAWLRVQGRLPD